MTRFRRLAIALTTIAIGVAGCGGDGAIRKTAATASEPILIRLDLDGPEGEVISGSHIGDSALCPDGTTTNRRVDDSTVTRIRCHDGELTIAFASMDSSGKQRSCWHVVGATGRFEGLTGNGEMRARFGRATFDGRVVVEPGESAI